MIMVITRAAKPYVIGKYGLNPGMSRLAAGPTPRTPSLAWASANKTISEPKIRNIASAVIAGIRYVLNLAYNLEIRHLATLSKNSRPKGVWTSISTNPFTSTRILLFFCCSNWLVLTPSVFKSKLTVSYCCYRMVLYSAATVCLLYLNVDLVADLDAHVLIFMHAELYSR